MWKRILQHQRKIKDYKHKKLAEKKIIPISREELTFLRQAILAKFAKAIDSPGDRSGYDDLSKDVSEKLGIDSISVRHSPGLFHKLMHDEGHNREFLDTCYRYISDNQCDRELYLSSVGLLKAEEKAEEIIEEKNTAIQHSNWEKKFWNLAILAATFLATFLFLAFIYWQNEKQKPIVWNMTTAWNAESRTHNFYLENFVNQVKKETNGRLEIRIFPDFQLPSSNGHNKSKEDVRKALEEGDLDILHSGPHINFKDNPEAIIFSTIPFGKNYQEMVTWMRRPHIKEALKNLFIKDNILTFQGGHSGSQYGGWYREMPTDSNFFQGKTVRFANFAGYLLNQPEIGAKQKPMLRYQFESMIDHIQFDAVEWQNPEEDVKMGMHLKGFRYYDRSHWNEPNAMFCFYINKTTLDKLPSDLQRVLLRVLEKISEQKIFNEDNPERQLAENTIEKTIVPNCNCPIKIFDMQYDCPKIYQFLKRKNDMLLNDFVAKNPKLKVLYDDYCE